MFSLLQFYILKIKWYHIHVCCNPAKTVAIVKDWGEPHQSCCPSNGQLGLTQSEVNYSHISVSMCVCISMRRVEWTLLGAPMC